MDTLIMNLGQNKVIQTIAANEYEQRPDYRYSRGPVFYEDLFKKKNKSFASLPSNQSIASTGTLTSASSNVEYIHNPYDPFIYILYYVKNPTVSLYSKESLPKLLRDFRNALAEDDKLFAIKKMTKMQKQGIINALSAPGNFVAVDDAFINFASHYLKANVIVLGTASNALNDPNTKSQEKRSRMQIRARTLICADDGFDTVVITSRDTKDSKGIDGTTYKMISIAGKHVVTLEDAKKYMFDRGIYDKKVLDILSVAELRALAEKLGIPTVKESSTGKKVRVLKDDLKTEIANKI